MSSGRTFRGLERAMPSYARMTEWMCEDGCWSAARLYIQGGPKNWHHFYTPYLC